MFIEYTYTVIDKPALCPTSYSKQRYTRNHLNNYLYVECPEILTVSQYRLMDN